MSLTLRRRKSFQFHKGTIKAGKSRPNGFTAFVFQFHKGTIKASAGAAETLTKPNFKFHKGTIKALTKLNAEKNKALSIP